MARPRIVGLGEVLWDMLPSGARLGGAPANFTVHAAALGADAAIASAVGRDDLGDQARRLLAEAAVDTQYLQTSAERTSRVLVELDAAGHASYTIEAPVAWDTLAFTPEWRVLAGSADAVCFGTLGQRDARSRATIRAFITESARALRIFDVNLRAPFWDDDTLRWGLERARIIKVNEHELPLLLRSLGLTPAADGAEHAERADARTLLAHLPGAQSVCVTLGERGSLLATRDRDYTHPGFATNVVDTVGAGDAFTAALAWYTLHGAEPDGVLAAANRLGSYVASQQGAMPALPAQLRAELETLGRPA